MKRDDINVLYELHNCIRNSICSKCKDIIKLEDENEKLKTKIKLLIAKTKAIAEKLENYEIN